MRYTRSTLAAACLTLVVSSAVLAQVGHTAGMLDPNLATEAELATIPNVTPALAKVIVAKRPFLRQADFNSALAELSKEQLAQVYSKAFVHVDLNSDRKSVV